MNAAPLGILVLLAIAILCSENRRAIRPRVVLSAFGLQAAIAVLVLYVPLGRRILQAAADGVQRVVAFADVGTEFVFGRLASVEEFGFVVAIRVLPVIVFASALISVLYYLRVMQWVIRLLGGAIRKIVGVTQVESFCAAANIFVGMIEAPLVVRPYLTSLSRSQFFAVLGGGLASVSGAILLAYAQLGMDLGYLIAASFMAAPGGLLMSKILIPDTSDDSRQPGELLDARSFDDENPPVNIIEAATDGAATGLKIALNVGAMLVAIVALFALTNGIVGGIGGVFGTPDLTLEKILGVIFAPLMWVLGIPWEDCQIAGNLVGQKTILNEFVAYINFVDAKASLSSHSQAVITVALCGFANLTALAIMMGGVGSIVPRRKHEIAQLGLKAILVGTLSNLMSAALTSLLLSF